MTTQSRFRIATATTEKDVAAITRLVPELAVALGLNESIILMQIDFWISIASDDNFKDGRWWTWQSLRDMCRKAFPYLSKSTVSRAIQHMVEEGYLLVGNYNKRKEDRTQWYAIDVKRLLEILKERGVKGVYIVQDGEVYTPNLSKDYTGNSQNGTGISQGGTDISQGGTTLPESTSESTSESIGDRDTPAVIASHQKSSLRSKSNRPSGFISGTTPEESTNEKPIRSDLEEVINATFHTYPGGANKKTLNKNLKVLNESTKETVEEPTPIERFEADPEYRVYCQTQIDYWAGRAKSEGQPLRAMMKRLVDGLYYVNGDFGYFQWLQNKGKPVPTKNEPPVVGYEF